MGVRGKTAVLDPSVTSPLKPEVISDMTTSASVATVQIKLEINSVICGDLDGLEHL